MTYKDFLFVLLAASVPVFVILVISIVRFKTRTYVQITRATIIRKMAQTQQLYIKFSLSGVLDKYPNIELVLNNTTGAFDRMLSQSDLDCKTINVSKDPIPGIDSCALIREIMNCPVELRKALNLNADVIQLLGKIKKPFWYLKTKVEISVLMFVFKIATFFPNKKRRSISKAEHRIAKKFECEIATVGLY